jgi:two-component system sensor histidine kinase DesK
MRIRLLPDSPFGWTPYAWLVYLSFFVVYAAAVNDSAVDWTIDGAALAFFLVLYFRAFWVDGTTRLRIALVIVTLGLLLSPRNPGASTFFIYGAAFLGDALRPSLAVRWLLGFVAAIGLEAWLVPLSPAAWVPGIGISLLVGGTNIHFGEVRRKDEALLKAHQAAERLATIAERERIARDLHDLLGHTLSVIVIKAELAAKLSERDTARAAAEIRDVERISRQALQEVRRAIQGYRGERVQDELATARTALTAAGVALAADVGPLGLEADAEHALALAVREAVTNVIRHARAARCGVTGGREADGVRLVVEDDGIGGDHAEGTGLSGMRARLAEVGGTIERDGRQGTKLTLHVPHRRATADSCQAARS